MAAYVFKLVDAIGQRIENSLPASITGRVADSLDLEGQHDAVIPIGADERDRVLQEQALRDVPLYTPVRAASMRKYGSPLHAFAHAAMHQTRSADTWPVPVFYRPANGACTVAVMIESSTYLVHARLDHFYRNVLCQFVDDYAAVQRYAHTVTAEQQDAEEERAAALELAPASRQCATQNKYAASDWVVYTHNSSALMNDIRRLTSRDALLDYYEDSDGSANILGIQSVPFPVVCFFCGGAGLLGRQTAHSVSAASAADADTVLMLPSDATMHNLDLDESQARHGTFEGPLTYDDQWVAVPPWFLTLRTRAPPPPPTNGSAHHYTSASPSPVLKPATATNGSEPDSWTRVSSDALRLMERVEHIVPSHPMARSDVNFAAASATRSYLETATSMLKDSVLVDADKT